MMTHEHDPHFYRLIPAWVVNEIRDRLARIESNQEKIMADTTRLTAATDTLTQAVTDLAARIAANPPTNDQPAIDAAVTAIEAAAAAIAAIDVTPPA